MATTVLLTCKEGSEKVLAREIALYHLAVSAKGNGWILAAPEEPSASPRPEPLLGVPCFAYHILENPIAVSAASVNSLTEQLITLFITQLAQTRLTDPWPLSFCSCGNEQLLGRTKSVKKNWIDKMQKRMSHVAKLAREGIPYRPEFTQGFFVHLTDLSKAFVSFRARSAGQQRMQMDPRAPSRSYLKIEEAFRILGVEPREKETVIDLGAAPGGWSYSALKRGAIVTAVDNGPLKGLVQSHPNMRHLQADALKYKHDPSKPADWLLCDILEQPDIILNLLHKWLSQKWCRHFIANIKVGRTDPVLLLKKIHDHRKGIFPYCKPLYTRQLYHDREEITLMGRIK